MGILWGVLLVVLSLIAWGGQAISWLAPDTAVRLGLCESEDEVESAYWADIRGEALWDSLTLWTMVIAGALLIADQDAWAYFGLVAGGAYLYFAGRGIVTRRALLNRGLQVGDPQSVRTAFVVLSIWGLMAAVTIAAAVRALQTS